MKTMTIPDIRRHWPDVEQALATESEILITRNCRPVARLLPAPEVVVSGKPFDPEEQRHWMEDFWGKGVTFDSLSGLFEDRNGRYAPE